MTGKTARFAEFPRTVQASSANPAHRYRLVATHFAVHGAPSAPGATIDFAAEKISVYPIERMAEMAAAPSHATPVYALAKGGTLAVPTGKVFVRLAADQKLEDHATRFRDAGYEIQQTASHAPNAGWLRAAASSVAAALAGLDRLAAIPGVENVEPQMLSQAARKR
jgi:hypothetical protein